MRPPPDASAALLARLPAEGKRAVRAWLAGEPPASHEWPAGALWLALLREPRSDAYPRWADAERFGVNVGFQVLGEVTRGELAAWAAEDASAQPAADNHAFDEALARRLSAPVAVARFVAAMLCDGATATTAPALPQGWSLRKRFHLGDDPALALGRPDGTSWTFTRDYVQQHVAEVRASLTPAAPLALADVPAPLVETARCWLRGEFAPEDVHRAGLALAVAGWSVAAVPRAGATAVRFTAPGGRTLDASWAQLAATTSPASRGAQGAGHGDAAEAAVPPEERARALYGTTTCGHPCACRVVVFPHQGEVAAAIRAAEEQTRDACAALCEAEAATHRDALREVRRHGMIGLSRRKVAATCELINQAAGLGRAIRNRAQPRAAVADAAPDSSLGGGVFCALVYDTDPRRRATACGSTACRGCTTTCGCRASGRTSSERATAPLDDGVDDIPGERCDVRDDGFHCEHWYDGDACCACHAAALTDAERDAMERGTAAPGERTE